jgi:hypothetical protein
VLPAQSLPYAASLAGALIVSRREASSNRVHLRRCKPPFREVASAAVRRRAPSPRAWVSPETLLTIRHNGRDYDSFEPAPIGELAKWTIKERKRRAALQTIPPLESLNVSLALDDLSAEAPEFIATLIDFGAEVKSSTSVSPRASCFPGRRAALQTIPPLESLNVSLALDDLSAEAPEFIATLIDFGAEV